MIRRIAMMLILISFISCDRIEKSGKEQEVMYYYLTTEDFKTYNSDSVKIDLIKHHNVKDTLLVQSNFKLNGETHWINLFSNHQYAGIDGGYLAFELDTLGIIYTKSTTWNSYSRLKSTNDSINNLITVALENIILIDKFHNNDLKSTKQKAKIFN